MQALAIDVGGTQIKAAIVDRSGEIEDQTKRPTLYENGPEAVIDQITQLINRWIAKHKICGVGIGMPGMIDSQQRRISNPPNFPNWTTIDLIDELERRLSKSLPLFLDNDANAAALGSKYFGLGHKHSHFVLLTLGTGVGGGIIINNKIYRGEQGMAGEIGHMILQTDGASSRAVTRGTLEAYLGQRFLSKSAEKVISEHPNSYLYERVVKGDAPLEPRHLTEAADEGDDIAIQILANAGRKLGAALVNLTHVLDIRTFIVAGGVAQADHWLLEPARTFLQEQLMPPYRSNITLQKESEPALLGLRGAAALVYDQLEAGQETV